MRPCPLPWLPPQLPPEPPKGFDNFEQWLSGTQLERELKLQEYSVSNRGLRPNLVGTPEQIQERIAESRIEIDQARLLVLRTAWALDQAEAPPDLREQISAVKVVAARLQQRVLDRAIQVFGAMGLSPDTPLAWLFTWGRALRIMDGPDEVHLRTVARGELRRAADHRGRWSDYFTTPEQRAAPIRIR